MRMISACPGQAYAYILRSPHAHARIAGIDVAAAVDAPGVLAVLTGRDAAADGLRLIPHSPVSSNPHEVPPQSRDGSPFFIAPHPALAIDAARYVGEPVAVVVAEMLAQAMDAAERVDVSYEVLPAVARSRDALMLGAPLVWEQHGSNLCVDSETGNRAGVDAAFTRAAHVVRLETTINRVTGMPIELRAAVGAYDEIAVQFTVYTSAGGGVIRQRDDKAGALGVAKDAVRVISGDVGGNFGIRNNTCPEFVLVAWAAKRLGRPVKWACDRKPSSLWTRRATCSHCGRPTPAISAPARSRLCRWRKASRCRRACTTFPPRICAGSASSPTRPRPPPIAAPGAPR
jgi:aerobic carbon-monoxide dehydrogenase large subunit